MTAPIFPTTVAYGERSISTGGMTLRQYYAAHAPLPSLEVIDEEKRAYARRNPNREAGKPPLRTEAEIVAQLAFQYADLMLAMEPALAPEKPITSRSEAVERVRAHAQAHAGKSRAAFSLDSIQAVLDHVADLERGGSLRDLRAWIWDEIDRLPEGAAAQPAFDHVLDEIDRRLDAHVQEA